MSPKKVMITGVYGLIAGAIYDHFATQPDRYDVYGLARRRQPSDRTPGGWAPEIPDNRCTLADLSDFASVQRAMEGMDTVVQMAADPRVDAPWESTLESNVIGAYNVFEACRQAGVKRIVFASTVVTSWGYYFDEPYRAIKECRFEDVPEQIPIVTHRDPVRPVDAYSSSKVWGEALARCYSDVHGLSCLCLRIGWVNAEDRPHQPELAAEWCSRRDIVQLVERCVNASDDLRFDIFYGISDNRHRWVDIEHARNMVGYVPQDRGEDLL